MICRTWRNLCDRTLQFETFEVQMQNTVWNWHEIQDSEIQDIMNTTNVIKSDYYNIFSSVAWISCIRKAQSDSHPPGLIE